VSKFLETIPHQSGEIAHLVTPRDGIYDGTWSGYTISFVVEGVAFNAITLETGVRGAGGRNNRNGSSESAWPESYPVQERKAEGDKPCFRIGDSINVSIEFAAGKYEGQAKVVTTKPLQIQFNFGPTKAKRTIAIGSDEIDCRDYPV